MRTFNEQSNVGRCKYVVNYHDGVKTHTDGSPFYDIATFTNRRRKDAFLRRLLKRGYVAA